MSRPDAAQSLLEQLARDGNTPTSGRRVVVRSAPGRLDVLGALGADTGGTVAQMALPGRVAAAVELTNEPLLLIQSDQIAPPVGQPEVVIPLPDMYAEGSTASTAEVVPALTAGAQSWATPVLALWYVLGRKTGARIQVRGDVPIGAGQASSTALMAAILLAVAALEGKGVDAEELATLIQRAERISAGTRFEPAGTGHLLDALTSLRATPRALLRYSTQPFRLVGPVPVPGDVRVLAMDTGVRYTSAHETLDELRVAGAMGLRIIETIYRDLGQTHTPLHGYLANVSPLLYRQYFRTLLPKRMRAQDFTRTYGALPEGMDQPGAGKLYRVRTAVDHLIAENEHAEQFLQAMEELEEMETGNPERQKILQRAGRLALASHHSYRLRLELSCREADWLVDRLMEAGPERGIYGARITGCGGGGTVMALVNRSNDAGDAVLEVMKGYHQVTGLPLGVSEAGAAGAAPV